MQHTSHSLQSQASTGLSNHDQRSLAGLIGYIALLVALPVMIAEPTFAGGTFFGAVMLTVLNGTDGG
ncbi:hypothetical protein [Halalkaliarchaeum desulfuricum]|nr:hypothetical protein [Halalkaliarchaeum desulfuricum]